MFEIREWRERKMFNTTLSIYELQSRNKTIDSMMKETTHFNSISLTYGHTLHRICTSIDAWNVKIVKQIW